MTEGDATDVREDVIGNDKGGGKKEPNHAFEDVIHYEMCLNVDEDESHVRPCELGELKAVMALLQGTDEKDKTYIGQ